MIDLADALLTEAERLAPSVDFLMGWGKYKTLTYRQAAHRDPGFMRWAASKIAGMRGQLCAEALAIYLGVTE